MRSELVLACVAGSVQATLEQARRSCWVIRAAGSLKSGLALTPGSDAETASSLLWGLRLGGLVVRFVARGGPRPGTGGGPVHHGQLNKLERLAGGRDPEDFLISMARSTDETVRLCREVDQVVQLLAI